MYWCVWTNTMLIRRYTRVYMDISEFLVCTNDVYVTISRYGFACMYLVAYTNDACATVHTCVYRYLCIYLCAQTMFMWRYTRVCLHTWVQSHAPTMFVWWYTRVQIGICEFIRVHKRCLCDDIHVYISMREFSH